MDPEKEKALKDIVESLLTVNNEHTKLIQDLFVRDIARREKTRRLRLEMDDLRRRLKMVEARAVLRDKDSDSDS